jgi:LysR family transcriptional regulator, glycine cleavage system transcriptional activator
MAESGGRIGRRAPARPSPQSRQYAIDAAIDGHGIALARTALAAADLINGRLVQPFQITLPLKNTYWIVCPKATSALPKIFRFRDWLLEEAAADAEQLDRIRVKQASARMEGPAMVA